MAAHSAASRGSRAEDKAGRTVARHKTDKPRKEINAVKAVSRHNKAGKVKAHKVKVVSLNKVNATGSGNHKAANLHKDKVGGCHKMDRGHSRAKKGNNRTKGKRRHFNKKGKRLMTGRTGRIISNSWTKCKTSRRNLR